MSQAPYGTWSSPITADVLVQSSISLADIIVDPVTRDIYHIEKRPSEGGRAVIVDSKRGKDIFGSGWNAKTRVQEYGGGAACVYGGVVYFSHSDGRVYSLTPGNEPKAVTPDSVPFWRFANFSVHPVHRHLLVSILEDHTNDTPSTVETFLALINTSTQSVTIIAKGSDFYASPEFSPDGAHLAYQTWNHPHMPWQKSEVHVAEVVEDTHSQTLSLKEKKRLAWDDRAVSVAYPKWLDKDTLVFLNDESGFQNPWTYSVSSDKSAPLLATPLNQDFCSPAWELGSSPYDFLGVSGKRNAIIFSAIKDGRHVLYRYGLASKELVPVENSLVTVTTVHAIDESFTVIGESSTTPSAVVLFAIGASASSSPTITEKIVLKSSMASLDFPEGIISVAQPMTLGDEKNPLHAVFYPPRNPKYTGSNLSEKPPCIVQPHGGPTHMSGQGLNWMIQYFTSRGWAWVDVNFGGSSGYGRQYMDRLNSFWGITDVSDCVLVAASLSSPPHSLIDPNRTAIRGRSSGGYTVLQALCTHPDAFKAGCSNFGISDLVKLTEDTHKFESKYMEGLLGGTYEEKKEVYEERSPVNLAENIRAPLLILQGTEDRVVPPEQADIIVNKIRKQGGNVKKILFEGEGHGWTRADSIKRALEAEREFYEEVFVIKAGALAETRL